MIILLLLLLSSMHPTDSCFPTSPSPMPEIIRCQTCAQSLIAVAPWDPSTVKFEDNTAIVNGCYERTTGVNGWGRSGLWMNWNTATAITLLTPPGLFYIEAIVTCDATGTAWRYKGTEITTIQ